MGTLSQATHLEFVCVLCAWPQLLCSPWKWLPSHFILLVQGVSTQLTAQFELKALCRAFHEILLTKVGVSLNLLFLSVQRSAQ